MTTLIAGSDTLIQLDFGDIGLNDIVALEIDYFTSDTNKVTLTKDNGIVLYDGRICAKLESAHTANFSGLLRCECRIGWGNSAFSDKVQNMTAKQVLPIKFVL